MPDLPADIDSLCALLLTEWVRHAEEIDRAGRGARCGAERERPLQAIIQHLQCHRFGRRSERLDLCQLALTLEDLEQALADAET